MSADHTQKTLRHISEVQDRIFDVVDRLEHRAAVHDQSKLEEPEASQFAEVSAELDEVEYGSEEYQALLEELNEALEHHYAKNRHHPEHFEDGVAGMTLVDLVEMFCDWCAATERHEDGDIYESIEENTDRFDLSPQLAQILRNTAEALGE